MFCNRGNSLHFKRKFLAFLGKFPTNPCIIGEFRLTNHVTTCNSLPDPTRLNLIKDRITDAIFLFSSRHRKDERLVSFFSLNRQHREGIKMADTFLFVSVMMCVDRVRLRCVRRNQNGGYYLVHLVDLCTS